MDPLSVLSCTRSVPERAGGGARPVGQRHAGADEGLVREVPVGHEDGEPRPDPERHDGAVLLEEAQEEGLHVGRRVAQPEQVAEQRQRRRARREAASGGGASGGGAGLEGGRGWRLGFGPGLGCGL